MSKKKIPTPNAALKDFFADNKVFADVFNTYMFGEEMLKPEDLQVADTAYSETVQPVKGAEKIGKYRDIIRKTAYGSQFVILGIENQDKVHYAMPIRVMLYDALGYSAECKALGATQSSEKWTVDEFLSNLSKGTMVTPIFTIVFYTGEKEWDGPRSLYEMMQIDEKMKRFVANYPIHVIDVGHDDIEFKTKALRELTIVLKAIYNKTARTEDVKISNSILSLAGILSGTKGLYNMKKGGETSMCEAMREMIEEGIQEGIQEAVEVAVKEAVQVAVQEAVQEAVKETVQGTREEIIFKCLKKGRTCEEISDFNDIPLGEVQAAEEKFLAMQA